MLFPRLPLIPLLLLACAGASAQTEPCVIETFAGGDSFSVGDGLPALEAEFFGPSDVRRGPDGLLYIADTGYNRIRRINAQGLVETVAGNNVGAFTPDGAQAAQATLDAPMHLRFGPDGSLYFTEGARVRRITPNGTLETVAGNGETEFSGDGGPAVDAGLVAGPIAFDSEGRILIASLEQRRVRRVDANGVISTIAGVEPTSLGDSGDGGPATEAQLAGARDVVVGPDGLVYISTTHNLRRILADGTIETYVSGLSGANDSVQRMDMRLQVFEVESDGQHVIMTSNRGVVHFDGNDELVVLGLDVSSNNFRLAVEPAGEIHLIDRAKGQVFALESESELRPITGNGLEAKRGDGGPATDAFLQAPTHLDEGPDGSIYISDPASIRRVLPDRTISTVFSEGLYDFAVDHDGNFLVIVTRFSRRVIVKVTPDGSMTRLLGAFPDPAACSVGFCPVGTPGDGIGIRNVRSLDVDSGALYTPWPRVPPLRSNSCSRSAPMDFLGGIRSGLMAAAWGAASLWLMPRTASICPSESG